MVIVLHLEEYRQCDISKRIGCSQFSVHYVIRKLISVKDNKIAGEKGSLQ